MRAFFYSVSLQWRLDMRSKSLFITCYLVPLLFFFFMGGIFTSLMPETKHTLIQSMTIMGVSMGAYIGLPPSLTETYGSDIKKVYKANGVPLPVALISMFISAWIHLMIMCIMILVIAPIVFHTILPTNVPLFFVALSIYTMTSLSIGSVMGLLIKNQARLTMIAQLVFLPSIMLSGILFPVQLLPRALKLIGNIFPAAWGYRLMLDHGFQMENMWYLLLICLAAGVLCYFLPCR